MKIAIIGAGFSGLAAAWDLVRSGHQVTIFERADKPGGLASGFTRQNWDWSLDEHYHHLFASDWAMRDWLGELGLADQVQLLDVQTKSLINGQKYQLDSPLSLLKLPVLGFIDKIRVAMVLAFFKLLPNGQWLERFTTEQFLSRTMGEKAYRILWQPLMEGKFGDLSSQINLAWFWARIKARTKLLGYPNGGFQNLIGLISDRLIKSGVKIVLSASVINIVRDRGHWQVKYQLAAKLKQTEYDQVLVTGSDQILSRLVPTLPATYTKNIGQLKMLAAITLVLELDSPFFDDGTYWLSVCESNWPLLSIVEHTNLTGQKHYGGHALLYVGKYLSQDHKFLSQTADQILEEYRPFLEKLQPDFTSHLLHQWVFSSKFAQPVVRRNHSLVLPDFTTPFLGLYWCSMQHVYPWDRGTNYAVKAGRQVAGLMIKQKYDAAK